VAVHTIQNFHSPAVESAVGLGEYGVPLFYIVSAFSLCLSLQRRSVRERQPLANYAIRRFFRIAPMFYLAILIFFLKPWVLPASSAPVNLAPIAWPIKPWHVVATVLFVNGWHYQPINLLVPGCWSVAVETNFYLLLPLLFRYVTSLRRALALFAVSLLTATAVRKTLYLLFASRIPPLHEAGFGTFSAMWLPSQMPVFALGILMFHAVDLRTVRPPSAGSRRTLWLLGAIAASVLFVLFAPDGVRRWMAYNVQISVVLFFAAMLVAHRPHRALVNRFTRYLGQISYSVYLTHFVAVHLVLWASRAWYEPRMGGRLPFLVAFPLVLGISMVFSAITYRAVEIPGQALGRRLIRRLEQVAAPQGETADAALDSGRPGLA
jgi:peptidoglycan/LPS O-acetylase OafA/YrhL